MNNELQKLNIERQEMIQSDDPIQLQKKVVEEEKYKLILKKVRENKIVYYGYPIFVIFLFGLSIFYFILPALESYLNYSNYLVKYNEDKKTLDQNFSNLVRAQSNYSLLMDYENKLTEILPEDILIGNLIDQLQKKADYYGLERTIVQDRQLDEQLENSDQENSTVLNRAKFTRLDSGEYEFVPDFVTNNRSVGRLIKVNLEITGSKEKFLEFMRDIENSSPILNLIFLEYQEDNEGKVKVSATFETYSLRSNDNLNPRIYLLNIPVDYKMIKDFSFSIEDFEVDKIVINVLEKIFARVRSNNSSLPQTNQNMPSGDMNYDNNPNYDSNIDLNNENNITNDETNYIDEVNNENNDETIYDEYYEGGIYDQLEDELFEETE